jgi:arginyl-tRNA--protein-N-Asp/Glu arginylyltransferase
MNSETVSILLDLLKAIVVNQEHLERKVTAAELVLLDHTLEPGREESYSLYAQYLQKVAELGKDSHTAGGSFAQALEAIEALRVRLLRDQ